MISLSNVIRQSNHLRSMPNRNRQPELAGTFLSLFCRHSSAGPNQSQRIITLPHASSRSFHLWALTLRTCPNRFFLLLFVFLFLVVVPASPSSSSSHSQEPLRSCSSASHSAPERSLQARFRSASLLPPDRWA